MNEPLLLRVEDVAKLTSLSRTVIYELIARHKLQPVLKIGRSTRVPRSTVERWLAAEIAQAEPTSEMKKSATPTTGRRSSEARRDLTAVEPPLR